MIAMILNDLDIDADGDGLCDVTLTPISNDADCDGYEAFEDCDDSDASLIPGASSDCALSSCMDILNSGQTESGLYWINPNGTSMEVYCDQETEGGGWLQCAGWQSRLDEDNGNAAFYPRDMFVNTYNDRAAVDGNNDEYWGINCAELFTNRSSDVFCSQPVTIGHLVFLQI